MAVEVGALAIVDDDGKFREYVQELLGLHGYSTTGYDSGESFLRALEDGAPLPSLVVLDVQLAGVSGYEVLHAVRERFGDDLPIIFVSGVHTESHDRAAGLLLGGDDYLIKPVAADELIARIRRLLRVTRPRSFSGAVTGPFPWRLTPRELEVLELLADGKSQKEISLQLFISTHTVATHIQRMLSKLQVHSRAEAVAMAYRLGLVGSGNEAAAARGAV